MCGYFGNLHESPAVIDLLNRLGIDLPYPVERAYQRRKIQGLITASENGYDLSEAMWWFSLRRDGEKLVPNEKLTSFNARDLTKPLWKAAAKTTRGLVCATELGVSQGKDKHLMKSGEGFALGCLYKDYETPDGRTLRSFAVITRPPHDRFRKYHEKAFPLFLPMDQTVIEG